MGTDAGGSVLEGVSSDLVTDDGCETSGISVSISESLFAFAGVSDVIVVNKDAVPTNILLVSISHSSNTDKTAARDKDPWIKLSLSCLVRNRSISEVHSYRTGDGRLAESS